MTAVVGEQYAIGSNSQNRLHLSTSFVPDDWISQADAARMRRVSRQAIAKLIKASRLRSVVVAGHTLVSREDVLRYAPKKGGRPKMPDDVDALIKRIARLGRTEKQRIFDEIKDEVVVHALEERFGISVQVICEAIIRAGDLTQRGIRGVIAETVFSLQVVPKISGWQDATPVGDHPYDVLLTNGKSRVRIQVKMQRRERGEPLRRAKTKRGPKAFYIVEVQRTRTGSRGGELTRPYRFSEFDLLAVCMQPSTGNWRDFLYIWAKSLQSKKDRMGAPILSNGEPIIETLQFVPPYPGTSEPDWFDDIDPALRNAPPYDEPING
jgi:hypothetical protein